MCSKLAFVSLLCGCIAVDDVAGLMQHSATTFEEESSFPKVNFSIPVDQVMARIGAALDSQRATIEERTRHAVDHAIEELRQAEEKANDELKRTVSREVDEAVEEYQAKNHASLLQMPDEAKAGRKHFNPFDFKALVASIDQSINPIREKLEMGTRVLIHDVSEELQRASDKLSQNLKDTVQSTIQETIKAHVHDAAAEMEKQLEKQ